MIHFLTLDEVTTLHDHYVAEFGGSLGIRDDRLLESAVYRPQVSYGGKDLYRSVFDKAAALFHGILFDHPFVDGNKRAALMCSVAFLKRNGCTFEAPDKELVAFPLAVEQTRPELIEIASWFKKHGSKKRG